MREMTPPEMSIFNADSFERRMMHPEKSIANVGIDAMTENIYINSDFDNTVFQKEIRPYATVRSRPLDKRLIEDILFLTHNNNNEVFHSIAPITSIRGKTYNTMNRQFTNIEEVINYFSQIKNNIICFYQMIIIKKPLFIGGEKMRILIRYATGKDKKKKLEMEMSKEKNERCFHNLKVLKERNEFFKKEEFIL